MSTKNRVCITLSDQEHKDIKRVKELAGFPHMSNSQFFRVTISYLLSKENKDKLSYISYREYAGDNAKTTAIYLTDDIIDGINLLSEKLYAQTGYKRWKLAIVRKSMEVYLQDFNLKE